MVSPAAVLSDIVNSSAKFLVLYVYVYIFPYTSFDDILWFYHSIMWSWIRANRSTVYRVRCWVIQGVSGCRRLCDLSWWSNHWYDWLHFSLRLQRWVIERHSTKASRAHSDKCRATVQSQAEIMIHMKSKNFPHGQTRSYWSLTSNWIAEE